MMQAHTQLPTIIEVSSQLREGATTSLRLTEAALERIAQSMREDGQAVFTHYDRDRALAAARASDARRQAGAPLSPIDGLPLSVKDLFDVAGEVTSAGSKLLRTAPAAEQNATVIERLLQAGAVLVGRTNMTEFAFSGIGINPHYGSPRNPWDPDARRITGGSSSGAAASVAGGMAVAAIGSDTGGSVRIPAALCGITGFKPTAARVPMDGVLPLAPSLDSIGPLAASVQCCAILDGIMSGQPWSPSAEVDLSRQRYAVPTTVVLGDMDPAVASAFGAALEKLRLAGARIDKIEIPEFDQWRDINRKGGLVCAEAWQWHQSRLPADEALYDPLVSSRIYLGADITPAEYQEMLDARARWIASVEARVAGYDALILPTAPLIAPRISELEASEEAYFHANRLLLRNTNLINFLDGCALSIPCHAAGTAPVGLMIASTRMKDDHVLNIGLAMERLLQA